MFKLVVLSALVAIVAAKPSGLAYTAPLVAAAVPAAVSHQSRVDVISKPIVAAYAAPTVYTAPAVYSAPLVHRSIYAAPLAVPAAVSHQSRIDVHSSPLVAPLAYAAHIPAIHAW